MMVILKVYKGKIAIGYNHYRPNYVQSIHAEEDAMNKYIVKQKRKNNKKRPKIDILVIRITNNGNLKNSKPCLHCILKLESFASVVNIKNVYYSNDNGEIEHIKFNTLYKNKHECVISYGNRKKCK